MKYIKTLREGENISGVYLCKNKTVATTKAGKTYYSVTLQDKTASIDGKIWDLSNAIAHFEKTDFIFIDAFVTSYNDNLQLNIKRVRVADEGEYDPADYMKVSERNNAEMYQELLKMVETIKEEHLKALLQEFFVNDKEFIHKFKSHSAAKAIHHSFVGGLMQHSLSVAGMCSYLAESFPIMNRDLLVTAALLHDVGKVDEISDFPTNDYTDDGQFMGHIVMGAFMVKERADAIEGFPPVLKSELIHCILSHHGELEYGSPKKPAIIEAVALSMADNTDAKLESFTEILEGTKEKSEWLGFNKLFESNLRKS